MASSCVGTKISYSLMRMRMFNAATQEAPIHAVLAPGSNGYTGLQGLPECHDRVAGAI
jgi:hypothetical protein